MLGVSGTTPRYGRDQHAPAGCFIVRCVTRRGLTDRLAPEYNQTWTYSPEFLEWMSECILDRLRVKPGDRILDVGCGTELYPRHLVQRTGSVVCVDPSARTLEQIPDDPRGDPCERGDPPCGRPRNGDRVG